VLLQSGSAPGSRARCICLQIRANSDRQSRLAACLCLLSLLFSLISDDIPLPARHRHAHSPIPLPPPPLRPSTNRVREAIIQVMQCCMQAANARCCTCSSGRYPSTALPSSHSAASVPRSALSWAAARVCFRGVCCTRVVGFLFERGNAEACGNVPTDRTSHRPRSHTPHSRSLPRFIDELSAAIAAAHAAYEQAAVSVTGLPEDVAHVLSGAFSQVSHLFLPSYPYIPHLHV